PLLSLSIHISGIRVVLIYGEKTQTEFQQETDERFAKHEAMFDKIMAELHKLTTNQDQWMVGPSGFASGGIKPYLKLHFPRFRGEDPKGWLCEVGQYFEFQLVETEDQVQLASFHLDGIALQWHRWLTKFHGPMTWAEFLKAILGRFRPTEYEDPVEALSKLKQTTTVASRLKEEIRLEVKLKTPKNLTHAIGMALLVEKKLNLQRRGYTSQRLSALSAPIRSTTTQGILGLGPNQRLALPAPNLVRRLSQAEAREWRPKGLCYYCDYPYTPGHKCSKPQLFMISDVLEVEDEETLGDTLEQNSDDSQAKISFHAISGSINPQTLWLPGKIKNKEVVVLIDGGSTHNFIDQALADCLGLVVETDTLLKVVVGNREHATCTDRVHNLTIVIQGFHLAGSSHKLQGLKGSKLAALKTNELMGIQGVAFFLQITPIPTETSLEITPCPVIQRVLKQFSTVFQTPTQLPPKRFHDHGIPLLLGAQPVSTRPYRQPYLQKAEIEKQVRGLLQQGLIRPSHSPFSSPVLLVNYFGHVILSDGVKVELDKIQVVSFWPTPTNAKGVRGFLGLAGYYRKFIKGFGGIATPLHMLVGKAPFQWDEYANKAFQGLKEALTTAPTLGLPNWSLPFTFECDASGVGIGTVLTQNGRPLAYFSSSLKGTMLSWSTYEKEMLAVVKAIRKCRHYLLGRTFVVKTDHMSLKYLLEQHITTPAQAKWLSKLLGYDYKIEYKKGADIQNEVRTDPYYVGLPSSLPTKSQKHVVIRDGVWFREGAILLSPTSSLLPTVLEMCHSSPEGGHFGFHKTLAKVKQSFWWVGLKRKAETVSMSMSGLPNSNGFTAVMMVVDKLSKYAHFVPLRHPFTAITIAREFVSNIVRLHGISSTWYGFMYELSYHPQSDGQTEVVSRTMEQYLRCLLLLPYVLGTTNVQAVVEYLRDRDELLRQLRASLLAAQHRMKSQADHHMRELESEKGDLVFVKLQPYRQTSVATWVSNKLSPLVFWALPNSRQGGPMAYRVELPSGSLIHDVFHVSFLRRCVGSTTEPSQATIDASLPNWSLPFTLECDASGVGIGVVLTQNGRPLTYFSSSLKGTMLSWSTYEKEMLAVVKAIRKWRHYLLGRTFVVKTDHMSLKYLLEQHITMPAQAKWLSKLLGYDYKIEYKKRVSNKGADALSRRPECQLLAISHPCSFIWADIQNEVRIDPYYVGLPSSLPTKSQKHVVIRDGVWFRERSILLSPTSSLLPTVLEMCHSSPEEGHFGFHKTLAKVKQSFWFGRCEHGFCKGLPNSNGFTAVMVVVDKLSKYAHFVPLCHPFTAITIAREFVSNIVRLHVLKVFAGDKPKKWVEWFPWAKYSYNTSVHTSTKMMPFEVMYGRPPPKLLPYVLGTTYVQAVDEYLRDRDELLRQLRASLLAAQHRMKSQANHHKRELEFEKGGPVAYRVELPSGSLIHDVFHVSFLRRCVGSTTEPSQATIDASVLPSSSLQPECILDERVVQKGKYRPKTELLVKWLGRPREDATWETKWRFIRFYPDFRLVDKSSVSGVDCYVT
nr:hypothetical protein [Tanacetum cinerariifolium]